MQQDFHSEGYICMYKCSAILKVPNKLNIRYSVERKPESSITFYIQLYQEFRLEKLLKNALSFVKHILMLYWYMNNALLISLVLMAACLLRRCNV